MPPRAKFTKEEIIDAAIRIAESRGTEALTARSLGEELGSSARPIFTVFGSMKEVEDAVFMRANGIYGKYVEEGLKEDLAFRGVGKAYIRFASERPRLFRLLFMSERSELPDKATALRLIEDHYEAIIKSIEDGYGVDRQTAIDLYFHLWVYSHGIAVLIATKVCAFTQEQITQSLTDIFRSLLVKIKTEGAL